MMKLKYFAFVALLVLALPAFAQETTPEASMEAIIVELPGILPEGVEYDSDGGRFLFGSLSQGTIFQITEGSDAEPFIQDEDLVSSVGIHIDTNNHRLLVTNSDASIFFGGETQGMAALAAYDLESGERLYSVDLGILLPESAHFANDVTADTDGNAYVTDTLVPVIYKVDSDGNAQIFIEDEQLMGEGFGLNGIDFHPDGYLLAAVSGTASVYKIPLDDPTALTAVELSEPLGIDGMVLAPDGSTLYAVALTGDLSSGGLQEIVEVTSEDDWATAEVRARIEAGGNATTVALHDGMPYFINAYLSNPDAEQNEIVPVTFEAVG
jgi:sugar lactone lactonase YvrE